jgi:hypothetical protein
MFSINDIVSLGVMLLMMVALIAAQANATDYQAAVSEMAETGGYGYEDAVLPLNASINARFDTSTLTISIDASAGLKQLLLDDK